MDSPRLDLSLGYHLVKANAPPGDCGCFTANGGFVGAQLNLSSRLGLAAEGGSVRASRISGLNQNLALTTYLAGPRVSIPFRRTQLFGEFLAGGAHAGDSYFPSSKNTSTSASTFAWSVGGGLDFALTPRFSIRPFDASYLHTSFPNGVNDTQRQLQIKAGVVMHFGGTGGANQYVASEPPAPRHVKGISLSCSTLNQVINPGQPVHISAMTSADPDRYYFTYDWTTTGGSIVGHGSVITINTGNLQPGSYSVEGRAVLDSDPSNKLSCNVGFEVVPANAAQSEFTRFSAPPGDSSFEQGASKHFRDLFFNYDQSDLRPDAWSALSEDTKYLSTHPEVQITIAGYADERGSAEYNLALGMQRAEATRNALVASGIASERIRVLTYGKERSFCSDDTDVCMQQNRRAHFVVENDDN